MRFNWVLAMLLLVVLPMSWAQTTGSRSSGNNSGKTPRAGASHQGVPAKRSNFRSHRDTSVALKGNNSSQSLDKQLTQLESQMAKSRTAAPRKVSVKPLPAARTQGKTNASDKNPPINFQGKSSKRTAPVRNSQAGANRRIGQNTRLH